MNEYTIKQYIFMGIAVFLAFAAVGTLDQHIIVPSVLALGAIFVGWLSTLGPPGVKTVKPSGTISILSDEASGVHPAYNTKYERKVYK